MEEQAKKAKEIKGDKTTAELAAEAAEARAGRRSAFAAGGEEMIRASEALSGEIMSGAERGTASALAAAGPTADLRSLGGVASEARKDAAMQAAEAKISAGATKMDIAKAQEEMGSAAEDLAEKRKELDAGVNAIIDKHKGTFDDDEDAMHREIMNMLEDPTIPEDMKAEYAQKAEDIKSKKWDV